MLKDKPQTIEISDVKIKKAKDVIKRSIIKKLYSVKQILEFDIEIAVGIYVYTMEELGKLLLLESCKNIDGKYIINYKDEFLSHGTKFEYVFNYLKIKGYEECICLYMGSFSSKSFSSTSFSMDLYSNTEARLGIFYMDFIDSKNNSNNRIDKYDVMQIPNVGENLLRNAIYKLEYVIKDLINEMNMYKDKID